MLELYQDDLADLLLPAAQKQQGPQKVQHLPCFFTGEQSKTCLLYHDLMLCAASKHGPEHLPYFCTMTLDDKHSKSCLWSVELLVAAAQKQQGPNKARLLPCLFTTPSRRIDIFVYQCSRM